MKFRRHGEGRQRIAGDDAGALPCLTVRMSAIRLYPPVLIAAVGIALFSLMDALMKHASIMIGAYSALLIRSLIGTLILLPFYRARQSEWPRGERLRIHGAMALPLAHGLAPGTLLAAGKQGIDIACGQGALRLRVVQREGGKAITAADYLNARRDLVVA